MTTHLLRPRRDDDLPDLAQILAVQQPHSGYPYVWPRPAPVTDFIRRVDELATWTAERDGAPVGHVSLIRVSDSEPAGPAWAAAAGCEISALACVGAFFVDHRLWSTGIGADLLGKALAWAHARAMVCCLDVVPEHARALAFYRRAGWREAGTLRPDWLAAEDGPALLLVEPAAT